MRKLQNLPSQLHRNRHRNERGQALVEFALIVPMLFIMLLGMAVFAQGFNIQMVLYGAAYEGARIWAKNPVIGSFDYCTSPGCNPGSGEMNFEKYIIPAVRQYAANNGLEGSQVYFYDKDKSKYLNALSGISREPQVVTVRLIYTYRLPFGGLSETLNFQEVDIVASCTMKRGG